MPAPEPHLAVRPIRRIACLGTGRMGKEMAIHLCQSSCDVTAWNRTIDKAEPLKSYGARIAGSATAAVKNADLVITMLSDGASVSDLLFQKGVAEALTPGCTLVDMSSIKPTEARCHASRLMPHSVAYLDAPVSGGTQGAKAASLAIMVGGEQAIFDHARPMLCKMGRPVRVGPIGSGQLAKLANQAIVAVTIGAVAEAMVFVEQGGADPDAIRHALQGGFADSVILQQHGARMSARQFTPGGLSRLQLKDLDNVLTEAKAIGLKLPLTEQLRERFQYLVEHLDGGELDHSGLYLELLKANDLLRNDIALSRGVSRKCITDSES